MKYYAAYGSNINKTRIKERCPNCKLVGTSILKGYELEFHLYLTIEKNPIKECPVVVYQINEQDEQNLDYFEGVRYNTYRKEYIDINVNGKKLNCLIYIMNYVPKRRNVHPTEVYKRICFQGYKDFGFDIKYLKEAKNYI